MAQYSKYFTEAQLTATSHKEFQNNIPANLTNNMYILGSVLDLIYEKIGPFTLLSVFRSQALQDYLRLHGTPTEQKQAATKSYHSTAQAADIYPKTMGLVPFMAKMAQTPAVTSKIGAYALKDGGIHFDTDTTKRVGVILKTTSEGPYVKMSPSEISSMISKYPAAAAGIGIAGIAVLGLAGYLLYSMKFKKA